MFKGKKGGNKKTSKKVVKETLNEVPLDTDVQGGEVIVSDEASKENKTFLIFADDGETEIGKTIMTWDGQFVSEEIDPNYEWYVEEGGDVIKYRLKATEPQDSTMDEDTTLDEIVLEDGGAAMFKWWLENRTPDQIEHIQKMVAEGDFEYADHMPKEVCEPILNEFLAGLETESNLEPELEPEIESVKIKSTKGMAEFWPSGERMELTIGDQSYYIQEVLSATEVSVMKK